MYSFGGNMTDSKGIALPVNVRFTVTLCTMLRLQCQNHISPLFSNGFRNLVSTSSRLGAQHSRRMQAEDLGVVFRGQLTNGTPKICFCCDAASNCHPTGTSYSHSKRHQAITPFLDAEPQLIMELPTSKILQTFHLSTHLPSELQLKIWRYAILLHHLPHRPSHQPSSPPLFNTHNQTPLTSACSIPAVLHTSHSSHSLAFPTLATLLPFSTVGGGANTQNHPPASLLYGFSRGGDIFWLERPLFYSLSGAQCLNPADLHAVRRITIYITAWNVTSFNCR